MVFRACHFNEGHVAFKLDPLCHRGNGWQALLRGERTRGHTSAFRQNGFLHVGNHQCVRSTRVSQDALQGFGVGNGAVCVRKRDSACILQESNLGHLGALAPLGQGRHWQDVNGGCIRRPPSEKIENFGRVNCRRCVWPRDHRGNAARGSGEACSLETFLMTFTRFTDFYANVYDAGGEVFTFTVNAFGR